MERAKRGRPAASAAPRAKRPQLVRVYVWQVPVRLVHWTIFLSMIVLSVTGYYIHNPFIIARGPDAYLMATMRFLHETGAFVFTGAFLVRIYWFFAGNRFAHWRAFVPVTRAQRRGVLDMLKYYLFLRWRSPEAAGHNGLAALAYLGVYALMLLQIVTGFVLFQKIIQTQPWATLFGWIPGLINIQYLRQIHYLLMFVFIAFTIWHVYSAVLSSVEEKNGLLGSIFSGHKFLPGWMARGEPEPEPEVAEDLDRPAFDDREPAPSLTVTGRSATPADD